MKKIALLLLLFVFRTTFGQFQMIGEKTLEKVEELKKMKLIVQVEVVDEKGLDDEERARAEKMCAEYNALMKEVVPKVWKFNQATPEFMTKAAAKDLKNKDEYLLLYVSTGFKRDEPAYGDMNEIDWKKIIRDYKALSSSGKISNYWVSEKSVMFNFDRLKKKAGLGISAEASQDSYPLYNMPLNDFVNKAEIIEHLKRINFFGSEKYAKLYQETPHLEQKGGLAAIKASKEYEKKMERDSVRTNALREENKALLSKKILLIRQEYLNKDMTEGTVDRLYPFEFRILSSERIAELLLEDTEDKYVYASVCLGKVILDKNGATLMPVRNYKRTSAGDAFGVMFSKGDDYDASLNEEFFTNLFKS